MKLDIIKIKNIKSIKDSGEVHVMNNNPITILAGQNESGKTSFLKALRYFEEGDYEDFTDDDMRLDGTPRVDCKFVLTSEELVSLEADTNKKIADFIKINGFNFMRKDIDGKQTLVYSNPAELEALVNEYNLEIEGLNEEKDEAQDLIEQFKPYSYFNKIRPRFVFYSSFLENNLPHIAKKSDLVTNQALMDFQTVYEISFSDLMKSDISEQKRRTEEERVNRMAADSLNKYWKQKISEEQVEYKYNIKINFQEANPETSTVNFFISQGEDIQLKISQKSHGFQWFSGFNLRLRAHEKELEKEGLILLIDEPGQGLHEVAQQDVKNVLEELSMNEKIQIIYTTHQPVLLGGSEVDFSRLLLVDKSVEKGTKFLSIAAMVGKKGSKDALSPLRSALGLVSISSPLEANKVIVVEGITEYYVLTSILDTEVKIIPATGADQVPNILSILYGWGIDTKVLLDGDRKGKTVSNKIKKDFFNNEESEQYIKTVLVLDGINGIEELLSVSTIVEVLADFNETYDDTKTKIENVSKIGKFIFARKLMDLYSIEGKVYDSETLSAFEPIRSLLN